MVCVACCGAVTPASALGAGWSGTDEHAAHAHAKAAAMSRARCTITAAYPTPGRGRLRTACGRAHRGASRAGSVIRTAHALRRICRSECEVFKQLAKNQNRPWFQAHKAEFEAGWQSPMSE